MNIKKLRIGMIIKNYKLLCEILEIEVKGGKAKQLQMKELERFIKFHKEGNKIIVDEIYETPKPKIDNRKNTKGNNNVYGKYIEKLVLDLLVQKYQNKKERKIYLSRDKMLRALNMINDNYSFGKFNRDILSEFINADSDNVKEFYILNNRNLYESVERALKQLANKCLVSWKLALTVAIDLTKQDDIKEEQNWIIEDGKKLVITEEHRTATPIEEDIILHIEREILESMNMEDKKDVFLKDKYKEFNKKVCDLLKKETDIKYYYKSYDVIFHEKVVEELEKINKFILEQEERQNIKVSLNGIISNNFKENAQTRQDKASKEKEKVFGIDNNRYAEMKRNRRLDYNYIDDNNKIINTVIDGKTKNLTDIMMKKHKDKEKEVEKEIDMLFESWS